MTFPPPTPPVETQGSRWKQGLLLFGIVVFAMVSLRFISTMVTTLTANDNDKRGSDVAAAVLDDVWADSDYCWSTCERIHTPNEWLRISGPVDATEIWAAATFLGTQTHQRLDALCTDFWSLSNSAIRETALEAEIDPNSWLATLYAVCDS